MQQATPFFFLIDFEQQKPIIYPLTEAAQHGILFDIAGVRNFTLTAEDNLSLTVPLIEQITPLSYTAYEQGFELVKQGIQKGNTYLLNLTYPTPIQLNCDLLTLFYQVNARYKLYVANQFVCFSPESFVQIRDNKIYTYPMKGTINADIANAAEILLNDPKERYEHNTIVDLMRNDLAMVASNITVKRFRYIEKIKTEKGAILQTSSEICGDLAENWQKDPLFLLQKMLPAGSISGAPKQKTLEIIQQAEQQKRGYYTGIFGIFDGKNLDSGVLIRYIEKTATGLQFRSGGGITSYSDCLKEYQEMLEKVYIPI